MSLTVRSWEKACSSEVGKKIKITFCFVADFLKRFKSKIDPKSSRLNLWFCQIFFSILAFQSLWTDL